MNDRKSDHEAVNRAYALSFACMDPEQHDQFEKLCALLHFSIEARIEEIRPLDFTDQPSWHHQ